jgi:hypothetical protein
MIKPYNLQRLSPLCYLRCLLFGSQRLTEANEGSEEEILAPKNFVLRPRARAAQIHLDAMGGNP